MIHVSAGEPAPIMHSDTAGLTVVATIYKAPDALYWNPTTETWEITPEDIPTVEILPGLYQLILPDGKLDGHFAITFNNGIAPVYIQLYAGGFRYNSAPDTCIVYGAISDVKGQPISLAEVIAEPIPTLKYINNVAQSMSSRRVYTNQDGEFAIELVRNSEIVLIVSEVGFRKRVNIPDVASVSLEDL